MDRYAGYQAHCTICYYSTHLLQEVQDLETEFPDSGEVWAFVSTLAPLLALAMGLRHRSLSASCFRSESPKVKAQILSALNRPPAIWESDTPRISSARRRNVSISESRTEPSPAENNLAERGPSTHGHRPRDQLWFLIQRWCSYPRGYDDRALFP